MNRRDNAQFLGVALALAVVMLPQPHAAADAESAADIVVNVQNLKDSSGQVLVSLWNNDDTWLDAAKAVRSGKADIVDGKAQVTLTHVAPGTYALCAVHDANKNDKLDTKFPKRPAEGVGCSRDAKGRFGPPKWKDALFTQGKVSTVLAIKIEY